MAKKAGVVKEQGKEAGVGAMAGVVAAAAKESGARATKESGASLSCVVLDPRGSPGLSQLLRYARCVDCSGPARDEPPRLAVLHPTPDGGLGDTC